MSMAIASDVDETSTGSSGNPVENEDTNMLADSSGSNQIDCTVHHYYEKLKDFAFDMPGGWTDATISLFIDTFKLYKDDFSRSHSDELKVWQKIVKRCVERSNNHKVFTVNSVMELAGSLKSHVLRNEYRKDDETFKMLYNDVVDIIPYFPNTTCDSVSQNLRLRSRTQEVKTFASASDSSSSKSANIDSLIIKYCEEMNLRSERYCCNSNWNKISKLILENHGIRVDVKKHLGDMKRKVAKDLKGETDPVKKRTCFYESIGAYKPYFDLMPPRTIKTEDFDKEHKHNTFNGISAEVSSDDQTGINELQQSENPPSEGPRVYRRATPKKIRPGNSSLDSFPRIRKILGITEHCYSSESDESHKRHRSSLKKSSRNQHDDLSSESVTSPETSDDLDTDTGNREIIKQPSPRKRNSIDCQTFPTKPPYKGRTRKIIPSSDDESFTTRNIKNLKRSASDAPSSSRTSGRKNIIFESHNNKHPKMSERDKSSISLIKNNQHIFKTQAKIELSPVKLHNNSSMANLEQGGKKVDKVGPTDSSCDQRNKRVNFNMTSDSTHSAIENNMGLADSDSQHDSRSSLSNSVERVKSKNIVTPINVKMSGEQMRQEASTSTANSELFPRTEVVQPRSNISVAQDLNRLDRMEESTVRLIEGYKEKVKDAGHSVMQLIPKHHIAVPPVGVSNNNGNDNEYSVQPLSLGKPPGWFDSFITDYKKHEMWKMHQLLKMQQELVDMENRKLNVLEKILTSLNDRKS